MSSGNQLPNLDKIFRDDDELDFLPSGGSNLAAIFGLQVKSLDNHPLSKQVGDKPSGSRNPTQMVSNKTEVIMAKAVHAFKLQNGAYASMGKLGIALTGNAMTKVYQIILYKNKEEHLSTVTVAQDFLYVIQPNNYSSYYDSNKENWSILFENNDTCIECAREIGLARYFSRNETTENVLYQDLSPANKHLTAKEGDSVSVKYFISTEITQPFKSNLMALQTMTVEISTDDTWESTLVGASKGLKRILFLPPSKQISLGPGFPKEKNVILEIEIIDIKTPEETTQACKLASGKASIISRMAKMGQSMLSKVPLSTTTDSEDTEDDIMHKSPGHKKLESLQGGLKKRHSSQESMEEAPRNEHKAVRPQGDAPITKTSCKPFVSTSMFTPQWSPTQMQSNFITSDGQVYSLQPQTVTPTVSTVLDPGLNMFLSETRITNAELRMGMSKIADNVQKLLDKFHVLELQNATSPIKDTPALDTTLKLLLRMNAPQIEELESRSQKSSDVTVCDNLTKLNETKNSVDALEKELVESKERIAELETQNLSLTNTNENLSKNIQELETSLEVTNSELTKTKQELEETKRINSEYKEQKVILEEKIVKFLKQYRTLKKGVNSMEVKENDNKNKEVKHIMNEIYHTVLDKFVDESYPTDYIISTIASTIKDVTLRELAESDATEIANKELEISDLNNLRTVSQKHEVLENTMIHVISVFIVSVCVFSVFNVVFLSYPFSQISSALENEPPPIPPIDSDDDLNEWLY